VVKKVFPLFFFWSSINIFALIYKSVKDQNLRHILNENILCPIQIALNSDL